MFKKVINTATFKQSQVTILGTVINGGLGAIFYILIARILGPSDFGLISVSIVTLTLMADILDFGTNTGLVKFVSANWFNNRTQALKFLKLSLETKFLIWILISFIGFFLAPIIAQNIFFKPALTHALRLTMFGVGGALFFTFATSALQSFQQYFAWSIINILTNSLRLIMLLVLITFGLLNVELGLITYISLPFFGFFFTLLLLPTSKILSATEEFGVARQFFSYNFWVAMFTIIAAISSRLDIFLNARLLSTHEVGIYSAASQLTILMPQLIGALGTVAAPKFSSFQNLSQMFAYFKKFQLMVLGIGILISLTIPFSFFIIPFIYGLAYQATIIPFVILMIAQIIFLISIPLHNSIIYYFEKPQFFVWVALSNLLITLILGYVFITRFGVVGAASTVALGMLFNLIAPLIYFLKLKNENLG